jgi:hypothetical protein
VFMTNPIMPEINALEFSEKDENFNSVVTLHVIGDNCHWHWHLQLHSAC